MTLEPIGQSESARTASSAGINAQPLKRSLDVLGWSNSVLAGRLRVPLNTVQAWAKGNRNTPPEVLAWLSQLGDAMQACPAVPPGWQGVPKGRRKGLGDGA